MKILTRKQIEQVVSIPTVLEAVEQGFVAYSEGKTVIPPVAALHFEDPPGDCHIKYGYAKDGKYYVVKIASGFHDNPNLGLPAGNGLMLLFDKQTGAPLSILLDEGYLTDLRTAAAGCIAAKYLAPKNISCIGIVGTGGQAYYQLKLLSFVTKCRKVMIWGAMNLRQRS
jgi:ornithine cyclodeaminase